MLRPRSDRTARSLRRQLVIGVSAIVSAALMESGRWRSRACATKSSACQQPGGQLAFGVQLLLCQVETGPAHGFPGQAPTVIALLRDGTPIFSAVFSDEEPAGAPPDVLATVGGSIGVQAHHGTAWRPGLLSGGSRDLGDSDRLVSAVSLAEANRTLARNT